MLMPRVSGSDTEVIEMSLSISISASSASTARRICRSSLTRLSVLSGIRASQ
jgi:hypothetical protein